MIRVELDLRQDRVALQCGARLVREDGECDVDLLVLDTGLAFALLVPADLLPIPLDAAPCVVHTVADRVIGRTYSAVLEIVALGLEERVDVIALPQADRCLLGMPILRYFHLLLAPDANEASWLVRPESPPAAGRDR